MAGFRSLRKRLTLAMVPPESIDATKAVSRPCVCAQISGPVVV
jgi:hypothetical protein